MGNDIEIAWDELTDIFKDGKLEPAEVPSLLRALATFTEVSANVLAVFNLGPQGPAILAALQLMKVTLTNIAEAMDKQIPKITEAWESLDNILEDDKIMVNEVPDFVVALSDLLEANIAILAPYLTPEFGEAAGRLGGKLQKLFDWAKKLKK